MLTFLLSFSLLRDFASFHVKLLCPYLASSRNRELLISRAHSTAVAPHHRAMWYVHEDPRRFQRRHWVPPLSPVSSTHWHVVRIHASTSKPSMESNGQIPSSDQRRRSFRRFGVSTMESPDTLLPGLAISRFPISRNGKSHDTCPPSFERSRFVSELSSLVSEV
jgi:hypothetical protein